MYSGVRRFLLFTESTLVFWVQVLKIGSREDSLSRRSLRVGEDRGPPRETFGERTGT